jgi:E3 ubiquitin-protein ligase HERC2
MASHLSHCRGLLYTTLKQPLWEEALTSTCVGSGAPVMDLKLSKSRAAKFYHVVDHDARSTVFSQAFRQLHSVAPRSLRRADKLYNVLWMGERSHDAGGPYRESWSFYCSELQSPSLPLLRRTQNGLHAMGQLREQWVLNPGATSQTHLELFVFFGKLMGLAIRNGEFLHLDLSPVVWKLLVQDKLCLEDLEAVDVDFVRSLRTIANTPESGFEEAFSWLDFTTQSSDERTVELLPRGSEVPVTFANRMEYVRLLEHYRLHEFDLQAAAVREGLATIVPARLLALFTWEEVEVMVCGRKSVDVALLKAVTEYSGVREDDAHVRFFWNTLQGFSDEERSMFLRFCWGRSRLPLRADQFPQRFKLQAFGRSPPDSYLPVSHTCFFSLELPAYSSQEVMTAKLTYAIYNCQVGEEEDDMMRTDRKDRPAHQKQNDW